MKNLSSQFTRTAPSRRYTIIFQTVVVVVLLLTWYFLTATKAVTPVQLPTLGRTASSIGRILSRSEYLHDLSVTTYEVVLAFVIATIAGIGLGFLLGEYGRGKVRVKRFIESGLGGALATPKFVLLPVLVLLIRSAGYWEKVIYATADGLIIMILSASAAAYTAGENERMLAHSYNMSRIQFFTKIFGPSALFPVIEALRISMVLVIGGVLLAEMYISNAGMGLLIIQAGTQYDVPLLIGGVIIVAAMAVVLNSFFQLFEKIIGKWRP